MYDLRKNRTSNRHRSHWRQAFVVFGVSLLMAWQSAVYAQSNPFRVMDDWAKLPLGRTWRDVSAVAIDHHGYVWVIDRCGEYPCKGPNLPDILKFSPSGELVKSFGEGMFVYPHGLYIDKDENVWVTDGRGANGKGYQVFKFDSEGKLLMVLGKAGVAGDGPETFTGPSGVVVAPNGDIFVADGHKQLPPPGSQLRIVDAIQSRVVKLSKGGRFIKSWGKKGSGPGDLDAPHAIAMDSTGRVFVGDEENNRVEIFNQDGKFLAEWKQFGKPSGLTIDNKDNIYVADANSDEETNPGVKPGIRIGNVKDGVVRYYIPPVESNGKPSKTESAIGDAKGDVYAAERQTHNFRKYVKQ